MIGAGQRGLQVVRPRAHLDPALSGPQPGSYEEARGRNQPTLIAPARSDQRIPLE